MTTVKHRVGVTWSPILTMEKDLLRANCCRPAQLVVIIYSLVSEFGATVLMFVRDKHIAGIKAEYHKRMIMETASSSAKWKAVRTRRIFCGKIADMMPPITIPHCPE